MFINGITNETLSFWEFVTEAVDVYGLDDEENQTDFLDIYQIVTEEGV